MFSECRGGGAGGEDIDRDIQRYYLWDRRKYLQAQLFAYVYGVNSTYDLSINSSCCSIAVCIFNVYEIRFFARM